MSNEPEDSDENCPICGNTKGSSDCNCGFAEDEVGPDLSQGPPPSVASEVRFSDDRKALCQEQSGPTGECDNPATHRVHDIISGGCYVVCDTCAKLYAPRLVVNLERDAAVTPAPVRDYKTEVEVMGNALDSIWEVMYPKPAKSWAYPGQVAAHIKEYIRELKEKK